MGIKKLSIVLGIIIFTIAAGSKIPAYAAEFDILLKKLVEKGILTQDEAQQVAVEAKEEAKQEAAKEEAERAAKIATASKEEPKTELAKAETPVLPKWIQTIKLKGDLRLRYQYDKKNTDNVSRNRERFRYRLGVESKIVDSLTVGFGLASGGDDPRSIDQTFQDTFSNKSVKIDYAYAEWFPIKWASITAGKMRNPIYSTTDFLWDTDIDPEGAVVQANYAVMPNLNIFLNSGAFILDDYATRSTDPFMSVVQPGFDWKITERASWRLALTYYGFYNVKGKTLDYSSGTNTLQGGGLKYNYDSLSLSTEAGLKDPIRGVKIPYVGIFGDSIINPSTEENNLGYAFGLKLGEQDNVRKKSQWQAKAMYRYLGKDAWLDTFPDSSAYEGQTDVFGPRVQLEYGILDNFTLMGTYYYTEHIKDPERYQNLFQVDLNYKF